MLFQNRGMNWASTAASGVSPATSQSKSLAEIQAEEAAKERERQEREKKEKRARQKEMGLAQASVWGSASSNLSWASKAAVTAAAAASMPTPAAAAAASSPSTKQSKQASKQQQQVWNGSSSVGGSDGFWEDGGNNPVPGRAMNTCFPCIIFCSCQCLLLEGTGVKWLVLRVGFDPSGYFLIGSFTIWHRYCRGPSADSVQLEHSSSVQHKGNPKHSTSKMLIQRYSKRPL